ncbi:MAG: hypothetical protein M5R36_29705 [Deltaproteobacteria bacterium]|nr:hypothetical protein [Deltaproteobacteria bacterium]
MKILDEPGHGHRDRPGCVSCHSENTHAPTYFGAGDFRLMNCRTCHNAHGTENLYLINEQVLVGEETFAFVSFTSLEGLAEGSYVLPDDAAGGGLCEVCHTATAYYTRTGDGEPHFTSRCTDCHTHAIGFGRP